MSKTKQQNGKENLAMKDTATIKKKHQSKHSVIRHANNNLIITVPQYCICSRVPPTMWP